MSILHNYGLMKPDLHPYFPHNIGISVDYRSEMLYIPIFDPAFTAGGSGLHIVVNRTK